MVRKYIKRAPEYLAVQVEGMKCANGTFALLNEDEIIGFLDAVGESDSYLWNAKRGVVTIGNRLHMLHFHIGQVIVWNLADHCLEIWDGSEFSSKFEEVSGVKHE